MVNLSPIGKANQAKQEAILSKISSDISKQQSQPSQPSSQVSQSAAQLAAQERGDMTASQWSDYLAKKGVNWAGGSPGSPSAGAVYEAAASGEIPSPANLPSGSVYVEQKRETPKAAQLPTPQQATTTPAISNELKFLPLYMNIKPPAMQTLQQTWTPPIRETSSIYSPAAVLGTKITTIRKTDKEGKVIDVRKVVDFGFVNDPYREASEIKIVTKETLNALSGASMMQSIMPKTKLAREQIKSGAEPLKVVSETLADIGKTNIPFLSQGYQALKYQIKEGDTLKALSVLPVSGSVKTILTTSSTESEKLSSGLMLPLEIAGTAGITYGVLKSSPIKLNIEKIELPATKTISEISWKEAKNLKVTLETTKKEGILPKIESVETPKKTVGRYITIDRPPKSSFIIGYTEGQGITKGVPKVDISKFTEPIQLDTAAKTKLIEKNLPTYAEEHITKIKAEIESKKIPGITAEPETINLIRKVISKTKKSPGFMQEKFFRDVEAFKYGREGVTDVLKFGKKYGGYEYGSSAAKGQEPIGKNLIKAQRRTGYTAEELTLKKPSDIDQMFPKKTTAELSAPVRNELLPALKSRGNPFKISKENPLLIETKGKKLPAHAVDIHAMDSMDLQTPKIGEKFMGLDLVQRLRKQEGYEVQRLSEQGLRRTSSTLTLRTIDVKGVGKVKIFSPEFHRVKDVQELFPTQKILISSKRNPSREAMMALKRLESKYPESILKGRTPKTPDIEIQSPSRSIRGYHPKSMGISISPKVSLKPSSFSISPSLRPSVSPKISPSPRPSPSPSFSISPSPRPSPSPSPSPYPSGGGYGFGYGSPLSPSSSMMFESPRPKKPSKTKRAYTPSLIGIFSGRTIKKSMIPKTLSGVETRLPVEIEGFKIRKGKR